MKIQPTLIGAIPRGMGRDWSVFINDELVPDVRELLLVHEKGTLSYGKSPSGNFDQWAFHEVGGGGAVSVPFVRFQNRLFIGVVEQKRPFQKNFGPVLNLPRGFINPKESHFESAVREFREEVRAETIARVFLLDGEPGNSNSAFFETWGEGEGVRFYAVEIMDDEVEMAPEGDMLSIRKDLVKPISKSAEGIMKSVFIPWQKAMLLGDMMTLSGIGRLIAHLVARQFVHVCLD
jgi:ADP-ribose pyrophosphatase YjhB (NUDIX family)